jgi:hypothetical protein
MAARFRWITARPAAHSGGADAKSRGSQKGMLISQYRPGLVKRGWRYFGRGGVLKQGALVDGRVGADRAMIREDHVEVMRERGDETVVAEDAGVKLVARRKRSRVERGEQHEQHQRGCDQEVE